MKLAILDDRLEIRFNAWERLWSAHPGNIMSIPLQHIAAAIPEVATMHWDEWRAPGTYLPGIIKAGTFFNRSGCEFWYITPQSDHLTLDLVEESFKRIILNVDNSKAWVEEILRAQMAKIQPA
jgi:hypothetical protein